MGFLKSQPKYEAKNKPLVDRGWGF